MIDRIVEAMPRTMPPDERWRRAVLLFSTMLGALQMSRFVLDRSKSDRILQAARDFARAYAGASKRDQKEREHTCRA